MSPGDVVLIPVPQFAGGTAKLRPALILADLPGPYQNILICGISTQTDALEPDWDEMVAPSDDDFDTSGLHCASAIRLSFLYAAHRRQIRGKIGRISAPRLARSRARVAKLFR